MFLSDYLGGVGLDNTPLGAVVTNVLGEGLNFKRTKTAVARSAFPALSTAFPLPSFVAYESVAQTLPVSQEWGPVCYGNGLFVALAISGTYYATSVDGINWVQQTAPSSTGFTAVTYGTNGFVAISGSQSWLSTDGINWSAPSTLPGGGSYGAIVYGNSTYVAIMVSPTAGTQAATSPDGVTWTSQILPSGAWTGIAFGNGIFVAVTGKYATSSNIAAYSTNGSTWTSATLPVSATGRAIAFGNGKFVCIDAALNSYYSTNGATWTTGANYPFTGSGNQCVLTFGNGVFMGSCCQSATANTAATTSLDGINWTQVALPSSTTWGNICFGNGLFCMTSMVSGGATIAATAWVNPSSNSAYVYLAGTAGQLVRVL